MGTSIKAMEAYISKLEMQIGVEKDKVANLQKYTQKASTETQEMISKVRKFCSIILEKDIVTGNTTSSDIQRMSLNEILDAAKATYQRESVKTQEIFEKFAEKLDEKNTKIRSLTALCSQLQTKLSRCTDYENLDNPDKDADIASAAVSIPVENTSPLPSKQAAVPQDDDFIKALKTESQTEQTSPSQSKGAVSDNRSNAKQSIFSTPIYGLHDLSKIENRLTDIQWKTLEIIGSKGLSEVPDILENTIIEWNGSKPSKTTVRNGIKELVNLSVLNSYKINTGLRWSNLCEFSTEGEQFYKERFGKSPVPSEMSLLLKAHGSYDHGYGIKDTASTLSQVLLFDSVSTDRKANYIKINDKESSIPDVIAVKDNITHYIEYECGTHTYAEFDEKCHKLMQITDKIFFVVPNKDVLKKLMTQIEHWIKSEGGREKLEPLGIRVYLTTLRMLASQIWKVEYDMSQKEPFIIDDDEETSDNEKPQAEKKEEG
ncbi:MAG: hypothetical protein K6F27_10885 [Ruminococcus sp.]|nr:hypothetical protein [Ruminococcus sp.]